MDTPSQQQEILANLNRTLQIATSNDWSEGGDWYSTAYDHAVRIALESGVSVVQSAGVIAAMSPLKSWKDNLRLAEAVAKGQRTGHTAVQIGKAVSILDGADPVAVLGGRKTLAFYESIINRGECNSVTVDRHIISAAHGRRLTDHELANSHRARKVYDAIESACLELSLGHQVPAAKLQATIWITWIRNHQTQSN